MPLDSLPVSKLSVMYSYCVFYVQKYLNLSFSNVISFFFLLGMESIESFKGVHSPSSKVRQLVQFFFYKKFEMVGIQRPIPVFLMVLTPEHILFICTLPDVCEQLQRIYFIRLCQHFFMIFQMYTNRFPNDVTRLIPAN